MDPGVAFEKGIELVLHELRQVGIRVATIW